eukprot:Amastigsp_a508543_33.p4 type:complete len:115 gc:universal Amastigsp_a508543_33:375-31(-)
MDQRTAARRSSLSIRLSPSKPGKSSGLRPSQRSPTSSPRVTTAPQWSARPETTTLCSRRPQLMRPALSLRPRDRTTIVPPYEMTRSLCPFTSFAFSRSLRHSRTQLGASATRMC